MPHLVTSLFRSSPHSLDNSQTAAPSPKPPKPLPLSRVSFPPQAASPSAAPSSSSHPLTATPPSSNSCPTLAATHSRRRRPSVTSHRSSSFSITSRSSVDTAQSSNGVAKMVTPESSSSSNTKDHHHHRLSFGLHLGRAHHSSPPPPPASLDWEIETPPVMLHGRPDDSTGALVSGQVKLDIKADLLEILSCNASLNVRVVQKRPFQAHCKDCENQITELKRWQFLPAKLTMQRGTHAFPFSALIEGHLPATMDSSVGSILYEFTATATTASSQSITMRKIIPVRRSIPVTGQDHHSVRVFPPTNIAANVYYPSIIHPGQENILRLHMNGLSRAISENVKHPQVEYWKLKKLAWRLDETVRMVAPACDKHSPRPTGAPSAAAPRKGMQRSDTHAIGLAEMTDGWKAVYTPHDSEMEIDLKYAAQLPRRGSQRPVCDLKANDGSEVTHSLVLEMVVVQEVAPANQPSHSQPTGTARILRMHFNTVVTEESAEGEVSWDCEAPPVYEDVPPSPPAYPIQDAAPAYNTDTAASGSGSGADNCRDALAIFRQDASVRGGLEDLPDAFDGGSTGVLEARGSSEGRAPSFP